MRSKEKIWSLAFFFQSRATSESLRPLLQNGTSMSSSMYNKIYFLGVFSPNFWLLYFLPLISGYLPFFDRLPP
jgi:hypothetical protein